MKLLFLSLFLLGTSAFAQTETETFVPNGVITTIQAIPANGGINPAFAGVRLKGTIKAGGNACEAQQYTGSLRKITTGETTYFVPVLKRNPAAEPVFCTLSYDVNFKGVAFDQTFILKSSFIPNAFVKNVYKAGQTVALTDLLTRAAESCAPIRRFCTKELRPQICTYGERSVRGNNKCEALLNLNSVVCSEEFATFDNNQAVCQDDTSTFE